MRAVGLFEEGVKVPWIARELRVSEKSVYQWRRAWKADGREALHSKGAPGYGCGLGPHLQARLGAWLEEGPAAHGWTDNQVWTAARVCALMGRMVSAIRPGRWLMARSRSRSIGTACWLSSTPRWRQPSSQRFSRLSVQPSVRPPRGAEGSGRARPGSTARLTRSRRR